MKNSFLFSFILITQYLSAQVGVFPYNESFENAFSTGTNVEFIANWTGNVVATTNRVFQGSDGRTGSSSLNIIPTSTFDGEVLLSLDLSGINNPIIRFYAYSKQNGSSSSTRPVLLSFSTSIDGGGNFIDTVPIGDNSTFPNDNSTNYTLYEYELPVEASGEANVQVRLTAARGDGSGSSAELVIDDFSVEEQIIPLSIEEVSAIDASTVEVTYNQAVEQSSAEIAGNYSLNNGINISTANRTSANVVELSTSTLTNSNYTLTVNNVEDETSNTPSNNLQSNFSYVEPLVINDLQVEDKNTLLLTFNLELESVSAETTSNYVVNQGLRSPNSASLNTTNQDQVTLTFDNDLENQSYNLTVNNVSDQSTLATANNLIENFSYLPIAVDAITVNSSTEIVIDFNQDLENLSSETLTNYSLNFNRGNPTSAVQSGTDASLVTLTFDNALVNNTYELTINNVTNTSGNATTNNLTANVRYETATANRQIVINEIFADPSGSSEPNPLVLPSNTDDEFIELLNTSDDAIDLSGFELSGGTLGSFVLNAGAYVILTSSSNVSAYQSFGDVLAVSSWNTLTNGGEQLILRDNLGNLVDSLSYDLSWYQDAAKADGGWSLEQINPERICSDENNWSAALAKAGGSPGSQNSIFDNSADVTGPSITAVNVLTNNQILVVFNEIIDEGSLAGANFTIDQGIGVINTSLNLPYGRTITLDLNPAMTSGTLYELSITGLTDCAGNILANSNISYLFDDEAPMLERLIFKSPQQIDLLFDEIIEESTAEIEANFDLNQSIGSPSRSLLNSENRQRISLSFNQSLVEGNSYNLSFQNLADTLGNASQLTSERFSFEDQLDTVIVISSQLLDLYFNMPLDENSIEEVTHYTADDGLGNPISASLDGGNNQLVHLVFDNSFPENSSTELQFESLQDATLNFIQAFNTSFTYDTDDPDVDSVTVIDQNSMRVYFDEILDRTSAESINNFTVNNAHGNPSSATLQADRTSVILGFDTDFEQEVENELTLTGVEDLSENRITTNRSYNFTYDRLPPRLMGLELISPTQLLVEFSEELVLAFAEDVNNYSVDNGIGQPISAERLAENTSIVRLTFANLGNNPVNTLIISNLVDLFDNDLVNNLQGTFSSETPEFGSFTILSDTSLLVQFTKELTQASAEEIENFGFDSGIGPFSLEQDQNDASRIFVLLTTELVEGEQYRLVVDQLEDLDGNILEPTTYDFTYTDFLSQIRIINANTLELIFETDLDETLAETPSNYFLDQNLGQPLTAVLASDNPRLVTLFFDDPLEESEIYELCIQNLTNVYGNLIPASRNILEFDVTPPSVVAVNSSFENEIEVWFNEPVDRATATTLNHYNLDNGGGQPTEIRLSTDAMMATLTFANSLIDQRLYTLTVDRVEDLQGKAINSANIEFTFESPVNPNFRDLVINEVYFDNELAAGIPNYEFIEIYNRSNSAIELRNFAITDKRDTAYLGSFLMNSNEYLTLSTGGGRYKFADYGPAMGLSNFPNLNNGGETLLLLDRDLNVIDSLQYSPAFYNDESKTDGGYTIELINPEKPCFDQSNFATSIHPNGGTPGTQNSVFDLSPDISAPLLAKLEVISNTQLKLVFSEAMDVGMLISGSFSTSGTENVSSVSLQNAFGTEILLTLSAPFEKGTVQTLSLTNVADCSGNLLNTNIDFFLGDEPEIQDLLITEIMATPAPSQGLPEREYVEIYNNSDRILSLQDVRIEDNNGSTELENEVIRPKEYLILSSTTATEALDDYGRTMGIRSFPTLSANDELSLFNRLNELIFAVDFDDSFFQDENKESGGYSIEMINLNPGCFDNSNWTASVNINGGTPGIQNSVFDNSADVTPPQLSSVKVINLGQLRVTFNESMDLSSLVTSNFSLSNGLSVSFLEAEEEFGTIVDLFLNNNFERGVDHTLTIDGLSDCSGNEILPVNVDFSRGDVPTFQEILITEVMASPAPSQGLPEREYFEIYNNSDRIIETTELQIAEGADKKALPSFSLASGEYLIVTSAAAVDELSGFGHVIGLSSFPTLTISDEINLENSADETVFQLQYDRSFYQDEDKDDGGFSIEMINLNPACYDAANWRASQAAVGGSPGTQNSVFDDSPDTEAPSISAFEIVSTSQLSITFSESMAVNTLVEENFALSGSLTIESISQQEDFGQKISIRLNSPFELGTSYTLSLHGITDCAGNALNVSPLTFSKGATPDAEQLIITEIMANPTPSQGLPEVEYIEVYNRSDQILDLNGLILVDATSSTVLGSLNLASGTYAILAPSSVANQLSSYGTILPVSNWPSLNNNSDRTALFQPNGTEIHAVNYSDDWFSTDLQRQGGYALEMIDTDYPCVEESNWTGSSHANGGTPGGLNAADGDNPDLTGPLGLQAMALSSSSIEIQFNEKLNPATVDLSNFSADNSLSFLSLQLDETNRIVSLVTATDLVENTLYTISLNNITDCTSNLIAAENRDIPLIIAGNAEPQDIIINEILFNPVIGGDRFVEFYNNSNKYLNLKGWKIAGLTNTRVITEENYFISPQEYFMITSDGDNVKSNYSSADESTFIEISSMPSLPNDEGTVFIYNLNNLEIDRFEYSEDYHSQLLSDPEGISLERIQFSSDSNDPNNWFSASEAEGGATPGYENSQARTPRQMTGQLNVDPPTFAPDISEANNYTTLNYAFDDPGNTLSIRIVNAEGRLIKQITQNTVVGTEGFFTWDGSTEEGGKAKLGYYMIIMEIINPEGNISYKREKVAIASKF